MRLLHSPGVWGSAMLIQSNIVGVKIIGLIFSKLITPKLANLSRLYNASSNLNYHEAYSLYILYIIIQQICIKN